MPSVSLRVKRASKATPKVKKKTLRSAYKRLKALKSGVIIRTKAGKRHNMSQKSGGQLFRQSGTTAISSSFLKMARFALVIGLGRKYSKKSESPESPQESKFGVISKRFSKLKKVVQ